ncbi:MAG TPA: CPBP family intramembrane glutamic endopeptidase [Polyangiales bacterium]
MGRSAWWLPWAVYGPLAALGAALSWFSRGAVLSAPPGPRFSDEGWYAQLLGLGLALLVTVLTIHSTRWLVARTRWARTLRDSLRSALIGATRPRLFVLATLSAVAEELFFRAALMPWLGVAVSSLLFGLLHVSARETYLGWMLWASVMGLVFACLFLGSGSLLAPMLAHATINYENMQYLCSSAPSGLTLRTGPGDWVRRKR